MKEIKDRKGQDIRKKFGWGQSEGQDDDVTLM